MSNRKRNMICNRPIKSWRPGKKRAVKACSTGKERIIHFGAVGYGHNYSTAARRSFRARHRCSTAKDKLTARYWACENLWTKGGSKQRCPSNRKCKRKSSRRQSRRKSKKSSRKRQSPRRQSPRRQSRRRQSRRRQSRKRSRRRQSRRKSRKRSGRRI